MRNPALGDVRAAAARISIADTDGAARAAGRAALTGIAKQSAGILFSDYHPSRANGGEELVLCEIMLGLARRGWRCLLAYHEWGDLVPEYQAAGIECRRFDLSPLRPAHPARFLASVVRQAAWARREAVGLLCCNSYFRASHAAAVKGLSGVPAICHFHLPVPDYLSRQYRWGLQRLDGYIAVSAHTAGAWARALGIPPDRVAVVHNPVDTARFQPDDGARAALRRELGIADDCIVLGYCGRLVREKGIDVLLRAMARLDAGAGAVKLLIVGSDAQNVMLYGEPLVPTLQALAARLGLGERVIFAGPRRDVERWYNAMDIMAAPSLYAEPFGLVIAEAVACERPVVASRVGGIPEILSGPLEQLLVPPHDDAALAAALRRLIDDPQRRADVGRQGRRLVERRFALAPYIDQIESLLAVKP